MKVKQVKVKLSQLTTGRTLYEVNPYVALGENGISKMVVVRPPKGKWITVAYQSCIFPGKMITTENSLRDMGIVNAYDEKRTFTKLKHAQEYARRLENCPKTRKSIENHLEWVRDFDSYSESMYDE